MTGSICIRIYPYTAHRRDGILKRSARSLAFVHAARLYNRSRVGEDQQLAGQQIVGDLIGHRLARMVRIGNLQIEGVLIIGVHNSGLDMSAVPLAELDLL